MDAPLTTRHSADPAGADPAQLKVLLVEDDEGDALLTLRALRQGGITPEHARVSTAAELERALASREWDIVISDWVLPGFGGLEALAVVRRVCAAEGREIPVILASGKINEAMAVEGLRAGASDFVSKEDLSRLVPAVLREVTEAEVRRQRRRDEAALRDHDALLRQIGENCPDGIVISDPAGRITYWNAAAERMFGRAAEEVLGASFWETVIPPESRAAMEARFPTDAAAGVRQHQDLEGLALRRDGSRFPAELSLAGLELRGVLHMIAIVRDVSERHAAEAARRRLTERLLEAQRLARVGAWEFDVATEKLSWTDEVFRIFERDPALGPPTLATYLEWVVPEDRAKVEATLAHIRAGRASARQAYAVRLPSGRLGHVEVVNEVLFDPAGQLTGARGSVQDVTEITLAQRENQRLLLALGERVKELSTVRLVSDLLQNAGRPLPELFQAIVDALPQAMLYSDVAAARLRCDGLDVRSAGWREAASTLGVDVHGAAGAGRLEVAYSVERPAAAEGPFLDEERGLLETIGVMLTNYLERRHAESTLRAREAFLASVVEAVPDVLYRATLPGFASTFISPAIEALLGYPPAEFLAEPDLWTRLIHEDDRDRVHEELARELQAGDRCRVEYRMRHRDGRTVYWIQDSLIASRDEAGAPVEVFGCMTDVTPLKQAQEDLATVNRALRTLSEVNECVLRAHDETTLVKDACRILAEVGAFHLAWIGLKEDDERHTLRIAAAGGPAAPAVKARSFTWDAAGLGLGPSGSAVRLGTPQVFSALPPGGATDAWPAVARGMGLDSLASFPLALDDDVVGCLTLGAAREGFTSQEVALFEKLALNLAYGLRALRTGLERDLAVFDRERHMEKLHSALHEVIRAIVTTMEVRDPYTAGHQQRVADLSQAIAERMALPKEQIHGLQLAAMVHDIGKIQVPQEILARPGRLSEIEFAFVKVHAQVGHDILKGIDFPWPIAEIVYQHHERLDGRGYPQGLAGDAILLEARILAVADTVEAMASHRPYRPGLGLDAAFAEIRAGRGTRYDADAVDACLAVFDAGYAFTD